MLKDAAGGWPIALTAVLFQFVAKVDELLVGAGHAAGTLDPLPCRNRGRQPRGLFAAPPTAWLDDAGCFFAPAVRTTSAALTRTFLLRHAVVIANADPHGGQALRRIQRLFLGWSDYDDLSGYENFGWWDLQGDPENADQEEADEIDLDPDSDEADDFAECLSRYE